MLLSSGLHILFSILVIRNRTYKVCCAPIYTLQLPLYRNDGKWAPLWQPFYQGGFVRVVRAVSWKKAGEVAQRISPWTPVIMLDSRNLSSSLTEGITPLSSARVSVHMESSGTSSGTRCSEGSPRGTGQDLLARVAPPPQPGAGQPRSGWVPSVWKQSSKGPAEQLGAWGIREKRENWGRCVFSGLEKTKQEGQSKSSLLAGAGGDDRDTDKGERRRGSSHSL